MNKIFWADKKVELSISEEDQKLMDAKQKIADAWAEIYNKNVTWHKGLDEQGVIIVDHMRCSG